MSNAPHPHPLEEYQDLAATAFRLIRDENGIGYDSDLAGRLLWPSTYTQWLSNRPMPINRLCELAAWGVEKRSVVDLLLYAADVISASALEHRPLMTEELREELDALEQAAEGFPEDFQNRALSVLSAYERAQVQGESVASRRPDKRYFMAQDSSCHWYLVEDSRRSEWEKWADLPEDDEAAWGHADCAHPIGGDPSSITFGDPEPAVAKRIS